MKKKDLRRLLIIQVIFAVILLILIIVLFMRSYVNYIPYTQVSLQNTTILNSVAEVVK